MLRVYTHVYICLAWVTVYFGAGAWSYLYLDKQTIPTLLHFITRFRQGIDEVAFLKRFMDYFTVRNESEMRVIKVDFLLAVEVNDYLCTFYIENESPFSCVESLQKILLKLPGSFIRISRNCIINPRHVKAIHFKRREVRLTGNKICHFSVRNAHVLKQTFAEWNATFAD